MLFVTVFYHTLNIHEMYQVFEQHVMSANYFVASQIWNLIIILIHMEQHCFQYLLPVFTSRQAAEITYLAFVCPKLKWLTITFQPISCE